MIAFSRGDVVLVEFVFSDESGKKLRPALVISSAAYHRARQEVVVAAITSNVTRRLFGDHPVAAWQAAGLLFPSTVTGIIRTIKGSMIQRTLGPLAEPDLDAFSRALRQSLDL
jgi:mRNA interferase MazF